MDGAVAVGVSIAVATLGACVSILIATRQLRLQREAVQGANMIKLLDEWDGSLRPKRVRLKNLINGLQSGPAVPLTKLEDEGAEHPAIAISHFFDKLGLMVDTNAVHEDAVGGFLGGSIVYWHGLLGRFIVAERNERRSDSRQYQQYFSDLARRMHDREPHARRKHLKPHPIEA